LARIVACGTMTQGLTSDPKLRVRISVYLGVHDG
jgi:hypothetical protein